jgi:hypothetical protein
MKVSCDEGVASHIGPESCGRSREGKAEALTGERAGWVIEPRNPYIVRDADALMSRGRRCRAICQREGRSGPAGSKTPCTHGSISYGSREIPSSAWAVAHVRAVNPKGAMR